MARQNTTRIKSKTGGELVVQDSQSDSPWLPVDSLERLHAFRPELVDWVIQQTEKEADSRRATTNRINAYVFAERVIGMGLAYLLGMLGIGGSIFSAYLGYERLGMTIVSIVVGVLAVAYLGRRMSRNKEL